MMLEYANKNICGVHLYRLKNIGSNLKYLKNSRQPVTAPRVACQKYRQMRKKTISWKQET